MPRTYTLDVWFAPNKTDGDVTFSRQWDQGKITKRLERYMWTFN